MRSRRTILYSILALIFLAMPILAFEPFIEKKLTELVNFVSYYSGFLEGMAIIIALSVSLFAFAGRLTGWWTTKHLELLEVSLFENIDLAKFTGVIGSEIDWIDRGVTSIVDLVNKHKIVIVGNRGAGKTREALELTKIAINLGLLERDSVVAPEQFALSTLSSAEIELVVQAKYKGHRSLLLLIDDIGHWYSGEQLSKLGNLITVLEDCCKSLFVIATIQSEQYQARYTLWFERYGFIERHLRGLYRETETLNLINKITKLLELNLPLQLKKLLLEEADGTPEQILSVLINLKHDPVSPHLDRLPTILATYAWKRNRDIISAKNLLARYILASAAMFYAAGIKPLTNITIAFGCYLYWSNQSMKKKLFIGMNSLKIKSEIRHALDVLNEFDISSDGKINVKEVSLELYDKVQAQRSLARWIVRNSSVWRRLRLHLLFRSLSEYYGTLISLEHTYQRNSKIEKQDKLLIFELREHKELLLKKLFKPILDGIYLPSVTLSINSILHAQPTFQRTSPYLLHTLSLRTLATIRVHDTFTVQSSSPAFKHCLEGVKELWRNQRIHARECFEAGIKSDPSYFLPYYLLGSLYYYGSKYEHALEYLHKAHKYNKSFVPILFALGSVNYILGDLGSALQWYDEALAVNESFGPAVFAKCRVLIQSEQYSEVCSFVKNVQDSDVLNRVDSFVLKLLSLRLDEVKDKTKSELELETMMGKFGVSRFTELVSTLPLDLLTWVTPDYHLSTPDAISALMAQYSLISQDFQSASLIYSYLVELENDEKQASRYAPLYAMCLLKQGNPFEAIEICKNALRKETYGGFVLSSQLAASYKKLEQNEHFRYELQSAYSMIDFQSLYNKACYEAISGNLDKATDYLNELFNYNHIPIEWVEADPDLDNLRNYARFVDMIHKQRNRK